MQEIEKLRTELDGIHAELALLFQRRLAVTEKIWRLKITHKLPMIDQKREDQIVHRFNESAAHPAEALALQNFFRSILTEAKNYLEVKLK